MLKRKRGKSSAPDASATAAPVVASRSARLELRNNGARLEQAASDSTRRKRFKPLSNVPAAEEVYHAGTGDDRQGGWAAAAGQPQHFAIARAHAVKAAVARPRKGGKKNKKVASQVEKKRACSASHVRIFRDHPGVFENDGKFIRCKFCKWIVYKANCGAYKVRVHVRSESHKNARIDFEQALAHNAENTRCLDEFFSERGAGGGVLERSMEFRAATMEVFMQNGVPLNKIDGFRKYLEYWGNSKLDDVSNMRRTFIPIIEKKYMTEIREAVEKGYKMSVIWDGTNRTSEWYAVIIRWVTDTLKIEQRVVKMEPYIGKLKGNQLAQAINQVLVQCGIISGQLTPDGFTAGNLLSMNRDREATNQFACEALKIMWIGSKDLECVSHLLSHVGEQVIAKELVEFENNLTIALNSGAFKTHTRVFLDGNVPKPSKTRWYSSFELYAWMLDDAVVGGVTSPRLDKLLASFLSAPAAEGVTPDSVRVAKLRDLAANPIAVDTVRLQMQVVVSFALPFVECCYALEGDGPCVMDVFPCVQRMRSFISVHKVGLSFPLLHPQIARSAALRGVDVGVVESEVRAMLLGAFQYFERTMDVELQQDVRLYHFCSTLNPYEHQSVMPIDFVSWTTALQEHFGPWLTPAELLAIEREFPDYIVQVEVFKAAHDRAAIANERVDDSATRMREVYKFWRRMDRENRIPVIRKLVQLVFTLTPSSASAERAFSMLKHLFDLQQLQGGTLSDYVSAAVMARFRNGNVQNDFHL